MIGILQATSHQGARCRRDSQSLFFRSIDGLTPAVATPILLDGFQHSERGQDSKDSRSTRRAVHACTAFARGTQQVLETPFHSRFSLGGSAALDDHSTRTDEARLCHHCPG